MPSADALDGADELASMVVVGAAVTTKPVSENGVLGTLKKASAVSV